MWTISYQSTQRVAHSELLANDDPSVARPAPVSDTSKLEADVQQKWCEVENIAGLWGMNEEDNFICLNIFFR